MCSIEAKHIVIKQVENSNFTFLSSSTESIVDVEDSESSLKVVRSHDPYLERNYTGQ